MFWRLFQKKEGEKTGVSGEKVAVRYLRQKGYKILETNFINRSGRRLGEIDIIAKINKEIVFIEVKTRTFARESSFLPEESINKRKLQKMCKIADYYLKKNDLLDSEFRFDAISVWINPSKKNYIIKHLKNIFI